MIKFIIKQDCCGCHACYNICPHGCIEMLADSEGFLYPFVDESKCVDCCLCERVCPIINSYSKNVVPEAYACINNIQNIRLQSSSGGIFSLIAEAILQEQGVVFGAGFDPDFNVVHCSVSQFDDIGALRGSKYVQSCIDDSYKRAREILEKGKRVLFSGTPCQIAGLKSFLRKDYDLLVCVDIVCHGVPSPLVWTRYRKQMCKTMEFKAINFRDKSVGWKKFCLRIKFSNGNEYINDLNADPYMQGFLHNLYLRPSCHSCKFKGINRLSDITLADFWGIQTVLPDLDDDKGTSLVMVNSKKGAALFSAIKDKMKCTQININQAIAYNSAAIQSVPSHPQRDKFFQELPGSADIGKLIFKCTKVKFLRKIYNRIRTLFFLN